MGKTVAIVVGVVIMLYAPYLAGTYMGLTGLAYYAVMAGMMYASSSIIANAMQEDMPNFQSADSYSVSKLATRRDNYSPVPIIYGESRVGGQVIWQYTLGADNNKFVAIQAISISEINNVTGVTENGEDLIKFSNLEFASENTALGVKVYVNSGENGMSSNDLTWIAGIYDDEPIHRESSVGSEFEIPEFTVPPNIAFATIYELYDATIGVENNTQLSAFNFDVDGTRVPQLLDGSLGGNVNSNNPIEIIIHIMMSSLSVNPNTIDLVGFYDAKLLCNTYGYTANIAIMQQSNIESTLQTVLSACRGSLFYSNGKWKITIDQKGLSPVVAITEDEILDGSLNLSLKSFDEIFNKLIVKFLNVDDNHHSDKVEIYDSTLGILDGRDIETVISLPSVTNETQAIKLGTIAYNTMRYTEDKDGNRLKQTPLIVSFGTTPKLAHLEIGDIISIEHSLLDRVRLFKVLSLETEQSGIIKVDAREHCETHFKNDIGQYII